MTSDDDLKHQVLTANNLPVHIAIIMDGNGRWAKAKGLPRTAGHEQGVKAVKRIVKAAGEISLRYLTLYTFSTENWRRPKSEVTVLMRLLIKALRDETDKLHQNNVRLVAVGDMSTLPESVLHELNEAIEKTKNNKLMTLVLALSYSGRWDIINAVKNSCIDYKKGKITLEEINERTFKDHLVTKDIPDPDLLIRTGGDYRISNFLLWELAYTELYIDRTFWPVFRRENLYQAIREYQGRERRFGMTTKQIQKKTKG